MPITEDSLDSSNCPSEDRCIPHRNLGENPTETRGSGGRITFTSLSMGALDFILQATDNTLE